MLSRKQKAAYLAAGAASTGALLWLCCADSAKGTRSFLVNTGARAGRTLARIQSALATVEQRLEEIDQLVHDFVELGSEQRDRTEAVLNDTWERLEQTRELILNNVELSSKEIATLLGDIRTAFKQLASAKSNLAA